MQRDARAAQGQADARRRAAVAKEHEAIRLHEQTAQRLREAAAEDRRHAETSDDPELKERWRQSAEKAELRADAALQRAEDTRARLRAEGEE